LTERIPRPVYESSDSTITLSFGSDAWLSRCLFRSAPPVRITSYEAMKLFALGWTARFGCALEAAVRIAAQTPATSIPLGNTSRVFAEQRDLYKARPP
jgi:hypothetical protein